MKKSGALNVHGLSRWLGVILSEYEGLENPEEGYYDQDPSEDYYDEYQNDESYEDEYW
jgi:hypothetical protein